MANNLSDLKIIYQADSVRCSAEALREYQRALMSYFK